nr:MAG TPA: hypothetical protein [Bacteriophage sp.]
MPFSIFLPGGSYATDIYNFIIIYAKMLINSQYCKYFKVYFNKKAILPIN